MQFRIDKITKNIIIMSNNKQGEAPIITEEMLSKSEALIIKYKNPIIAVIAAIVIIMAGTMLYNTYVAEPAEKEAAEAMFMAENMFAAQRFEEAFNGDEINLGFKQIADDYSGTKAGNLANAYAGMSLAQIAKYDEAIDYLKKFDGNDQMVAPAAYGTLGNCYAQTGDAEAAIKYFKKAAEIADNNTISPYYLLQAGIVYEQIGKPAKALKLYEQIQKEYANSPAAGNIEKYIGRVK